MNERYISDEVRETLHLIIDKTKELGGGIDAPVMISWKYAKAMLDEIEEYRKSDAFKWNGLLKNQAAEIQSLKAKIHAAKIDFNLEDCPKCKRLCYPNDICLGCGRGTYKDGD